MQRKEGRMPERGRPSFMTFTLRRRRQERIQPGSRPAMSTNARGGYLLSRALLFVPALGLLAFSLWQRTEGPVVPTSLDEPAEPMRTGTVGSIEGWEGVVTREGAGPLRLRLEPLHPEGGRQAFDAGVLADVLRSPRAAADEAAGEGTDSDVPEPWRLTLSVAARPGAASPSSTVIENLRQVSLDGLEPLVPSGASSSGPPGEPVDPLVALSDFPDAPLLEGESCDLVFWGLRPEGPVRAILPGIGDVQLLAKVRSANSSTVSIARLDARRGDSPPASSEKASGLEGSRGQEAGR